jgi:hypothetical protein
LIASKQDHNHAAGGLRFDYGWFLKRRLRSNLRLGATDAPGRGSPDHYGGAAAERHNDSPLTCWKVDISSCGTERLLPPADYRPQSAGVRKLLK